MAAVSVSVRKGWWAPVCTKVVRLSAPVISMCRSIERNGVMPMPCASMTTSGVRRGRVKAPTGPMKCTVDPSASAQGLFEPAVRGEPRAQGDYVFFGGGGDGHRFRAAAGDGPEGMLAGGEAQRPAWPEMHRRGPVLVDVHRGEVKARDARVEHGGLRSRCSRVVLDVRGHLRMGVWWDERRGMCGQAVQTPGTACFR